MEPLSFFFVLIKCLLLLALVAVLVRTLSTHPKPTRRSWWQQKSPKPSASLKAPRLDVQFLSAEQLRFEWRDVAGATHYQLLERPGSNSVFQPVSATIPAGREVQAINQLLHRKLNSQYVLRAYHDRGYADSPALCISERLMVKLNYLQKHEIDPTAFFGFAINQSAGGRTLIIAEHNDPNPSDPNAAAYVFLRDSKGQWNKLAYMRGNSTTPLAPREDNAEAPQISPAEPIQPRRRPRQRWLFPLNPNWQDAARNLRWLNFNSP